MRMPVQVERIDHREALRYLGWRGECADEQVLRQLKAAEETALANAQPRIVFRRFPLLEDLRIGGTVFTPQGEDIKKILAPCREVLVMAATLGAASEKSLLRAQAGSAADALVLDAVYSALIEQVCDASCGQIQEELGGEGLSLTRRFSPGYGDMPLEQTAMICAVLDAQRSIGLTVSSSGLMIPRKSVTALMGISSEHIDATPSGCMVCRMKAHCQIRKSGAVCRVRMEE